MRLLITNDDGAHAEGIRVLAAELAAEHEVLVFAPDQERSGVSHAMTLRSPGRVRRLGEREYSCSGTPADCVILAGLGALDFKPEAVVSGINRGPNLGTDIIYSGTCAAARQASLHGLPGIAVSTASYREPFEYLAAADFVRRNLALLVEAASEGCFVNVNAPSLALRGLAGRWALPCDRRYRDKLACYEAPDGSTYCFLHDSDIESGGQPWSDHEVVAAGEVAVSRVLTRPQVPASLRAGLAFG